MTVRVLEGHVLNVLRGLPSDTFQCVATSPPYYGLRDYGLPPQVWGGEPGHEHIWGDGLVTRAAGYEQGEKARWNHRVNGRGEEQERILSKEPGWTRKDVVQGQFCACGAWLGSLGLEPTPELYVEHMTSVFREVRRVLRPDGVCWVNLGDSYAGSGKGPSNSLSSTTHSPSPHSQAAGEAMRRNRAQFANGQAPTEWLPVPTGCKPKDLLGMPWMVAFALRADGWYLRADIIWSKPNPMPESITDRPTKVHEYVFLLSKSRTYFYNADAIREQRTSDEDALTFRGDCYVGGQPGPRGVVGNKRIKRPDGWDTAPGAHGSYHRDGREAGATIEALVKDGRNKRSVWEIATAPFKDAHFATFPPKMVEPMLLAGSRPGDHVLDPFGGAGTTALVADRLGRDCTLIELNHAYASMARERIEQDAPLFAGVPIAIQPRAAKAVETPRNDGDRWNQNNGRGFFPPEVVA